MPCWLLVSIRSAWAALIRIKIFFRKKLLMGNALDAHRRMTRFFNNFVLTATDDLPSVKASLKAGLVYFVVEGLGTPMGLDFKGLVAGSTVEMGSTLSVVSPQTSSLEFQIPRVQEKFPGMDSGHDPEIWAELHFIDENARESIVKRVSGAGSALSFSDPVSGNYRVHVFMKPHHLKEFLFDEDHENDTYQWIISNSIKVNRT